MATKKTTVKTTVKTAETVDLPEIPKKYKMTPRVTEKAYLAQTERTYLFFVPTDASKQQVKSLIEDQFKVKVDSVRVLTRKGKKTRFSKGKHAYPGTTFRRDHKLAYVTLKEGEKIHVDEFEEAEKAVEEAKNEKKDKKDAKASAKADKKSEKKGAK